MTSIWGPLGWMTLHSISINYPERPTQEDIQTVTRFIDRFGECITCPACKDHFQGIFSTYSRYNPNWASSRYELFLFVVRAHNSVNKRLDKPIIKTVKDCIQTMRNNTTYNSFAVYRQKYINHVIKNWNAFQDSSGFMMAAIAKDLDYLNKTYWSLRETDVNTLEFPEADVITPILDTSRVPNSSQFGISISKNINVKVGFKGGRLSLGSK
jgi:hypothetical protein